MFTALRVNAYGTECIRIRNYALMFSELSVKIVYGTKYSCLRHKLLAFKAQCLRLRHGVYVYGTVFTFTVERLRLRHVVYVLGTVFTFTTQ